MIHTIDVIKYWSLAAVPLAIVFFVLPSGMRVRHRILWAIFLLLCGLKGVAYEWFGGNAMAPDLPEGLLWIWNWADNGMFFLVILSFFRWLFGRKGGTRFLPILAWGLAAWGQYNGTCAPSVREIELAFENLPAALDGYRIVQISDLHCSSAARKWRTQAIVDRANALEADLVCLTGDYVDGKCACLSDDMRPLLSLRAKDGVYAIRGNHEYYGDWRAWRAWFAANGVRFLVNECAFPHEGLALGGVNDDEKAVEKGDAGADIARTFASATNGEFRLLLEHRPGRASENILHGVDLQLSGHTHGGVAPGVDRLVKAWNAGFVRGLYRIDGHALYVSPGCGQWVGFPMRFFNPSEITLFTLKSPVCHSP